MKTAHVLVLLGAMAKSSVSHTLPRSKDCSAHYYSTGHSPTSSSSTGGSSTGGYSTGGYSTGGSSTGGSSTSGSSTGPYSAGNSSTGNSSTGSSPTGSSSTGSSPTGSSPTGSSPTGSYPTGSSSTGGSSASNASTVAPGMSWMGANLYYLQGLSDSDQDTYINQMANDGAKVVRIWVNALTAGSCEKGSSIAVTVPSLETTIGQYNDETLDALDKVMVKLSNSGIKALISPHDANALLGDYRADAYFDKYGAANFYQQQDAFDAYDARLSHILNYQGATSGKVWKEWSEAIFGFNVQNEPMTSYLDACTGDDAQGWLCGRATHLRGELGADSPILVTSGGIGGDYSHGCTFMAAATGCAALDAIAMHRYAAVPGGWSTSAPGWVEEASGAGSGDKLVYLEEWGVDKASYDQASAFPSEAADMNSVGLPSLYWQIILPDVAGCAYDPATDSGDHFGIALDAGVDIAGPMHQAGESKALQDWSAVF